MTEKLQKVLARAGFGSRREIETWIAKGRIKVNGKVAVVGDRVGDDDKVVVDGKKLAPQTCTPTLIGPGAQSRANPRLGDA